MQKLKIGDEVVIVAGKDKGKKSGEGGVGPIKSINYAGQSVVVEGVNVKKKAIRASQENPNGGFAEIESPIHLSNVMLKSPKDSKPTRVRIEKKDKKNVRVAVRCGTVLS